MRPLSSAANSTPTVLSNTEEKIPLGDEVFCSKAAYKELISVEESHVDWAYALLKGVFGEKAHLMRMRIKNKNTANERFSSNFLMVAKAMHRDWLAQQNIRNENGQLSSKYSSTEIERYVNALPAYLADRAYDMLGPRGINAKRKNGENVERRQNNLTKKRKYTRRGQPLVELQQPLQQEPMQHQSLQHQSLQQEPLQQEPLQQEPLQYQTPWQQIPQQHSSQQQSLQQEPLQHQSPRQQIPQQYSSQQQSLQQEPLQQEPLQHQSPRQQIPQHHPSQQQSLQQEPLQHQPPQQYQPFRFDLPPTASEPETLENFSPFATYSSL
ncbi:mediator of RNA polymerase II transcription subunit 15-like isoform X2 [Solenopsis invicta]|nr:mediator of RNA polymerase II transcription subunit 15-like isoform X2 [Solenopsis invicta]